MMTADGLSRHEARVVLRDPVLDLLLELAGLLEDLRGLGVADDVRGVVVELVPLPPAGLEVGDQARNARADGQLRGRETDLVMTLPRDDPVARTGDGHLGRLEGRIVGRGEGSVGREAGHAGVVEVAIDEGPQIIELALARGVRPDAVRVQELASRSSSPPTMKSFAPPMTVPRK